jgi:PAS domain S-box-containing protein
MQFPADSPAESTAVFVVTLDGVIVSWNPAAERLFGDRAADVLGRSFASYLPATFRASAHRILEQAARSQRTQTQEADLLTKDGAVRRLSLTVSPLGWDAEGRVRRLSVAAREPGTDARLLLETLASDSAAMAIWDDRTGTHAFVTPAYARLHGAAAEDLTGRPVRDVVPAEGHALLDDALRRARHAGRHVFESRHRAADGGVFPVLVDSTAVRDASGEAPYRVVTVHDLSHVAWLEDHARLYHDARREARRLESAFAGAVDGLLVADMDGRVVLANDRAASIFGVSKEELLVPLAEYPARFRLRTPAGERHPVPLGRRALAGETVEPLERIITAADGTERFLRTGAAPLRDETGRIEGAVMVIADVTEDKRREAALRESEERYRDLVEGLDAIVWEADPATWRFTYVNRRAERILGYPVERWLSDKDFWVDILHPDDRAEAVRSCSEAVAAGRDNDFEYRVVAADGRVVFIRDLVYVTTGADGSAARIRGIMFDVTEKTRARQALLETQAREHARAEELRSVLESTPAVVWIAHDPECRRVTGNRAGYALFRLPEGSNAASTASLAPLPRPFRILEDGRELAPEAFPVQRAARGERLLDYECEIAFDDGSRLRLLGNAVPLRDAGGALRGAVATFVDITGRVRAEAEARDLNRTLEARVEERTRELQHALDELNAFAYTVAHDLRAPLRAMHAFGDILLSEYQDRALDDEGRGYIRRIRDGSRRLDTLIQGLLEYSRLGRSETELGPVDLAATVADAQAQLRSELDAAGTQVTMRGPFPRVRGNPLLLTQAAANLLSNASKFVAAGVRPRVEVSAEERAGRVRLLVRDNGIGIDPAHQERIFGVFERLHPAGAYPGTGIGLAIVRRAVERMGGAVGLASAPGRGSTFWIELPRLDAGR